VFDAEYRHFKDRVGKALSDLEDRKKEMREQVYMKFVRGF